MDYVNDYQTSDLPLATVIAMFSPIKSIDKTNPKRVLWTFEHTRDLEDLISSYYRKELQIEPIAYFAQLSFMKTMLYSQD